MNIIFISEILKYSVNIYYECHRTAEGQKSTFEPSA